MSYIQESNMELTTNITMTMLKESIEKHTVLCAIALIYEKDKGLHFNLNGISAFMPFDEVAYSPDGKTPKEATVITRVNKKVCFTVTDIITDEKNTTVIISRKAVQKNYYEDFIEKLVPGDVIECAATHIDSFGVFCDIGYGITALLPINFISVSRINSPRDRFQPGQNLYACIKSIDSSGRIVLTHKELLGSWMENAQLFRPMTTAVGVVRSIEDYGIFIELMPNLAGLAEICPGVEVGDVVNVYIKSILPDKMKVKLVIMSVLEENEFTNDIKYFITDGHIDHWRYSTDSNIKNVYTDFQ